jgi:hypothetical protein
LNKDQERTCTTTTFETVFYLQASFVLEVEVVRAHERLVQAEEEMEGLDARPAKFKFQP